MLLIRYLFTIYLIFSNVFKNNIDGNVINKLRNIRRDNNGVWYGACMKDGSTEE